MNHWTAPFAPPEEGQARSDCRSFVAIEEGLRLSDMEAVDSGDVVEVAIAIPVNILSLGNSPFKKRAVTQSVTATMQFLGQSMEGLDLGSRQKTGSSLTERAYGRVRDVHRRRPEPQSWLLRHRHSAPWPSDPAG